MANSVKKSNKLAKEICNGGYRYLYGAKGENYTTALVNKFASLYPSVFTPSLKSLALKDADKGYKGIDCSGFVCKVLGVPAMGSSQMKNTAVKSYAVSKANAKPGMALWRNGHIAYVGDNLRIYEAKSTAQDMCISTWESRASAFTALIIVKGSALANGSTASSSQNKTPTTSQSSSGNSVIKAGQQHANNFAQCGLTTDGIRGTKTKKASIKCVQRALNCDYDANIKEDGVWGNATENAFGRHYVKVGETQYLVTALEIICMLKGINPNGVECPGKFGNGLAQACGTTKAYKDTFKALCE